MTIKSLSIILLLLIVFGKLNGYSETIIQKQDTILQRAAKMDDLKAVYYLADVINVVAFKEPQKALKYIDYYSQIERVKNDSFEKCYVLMNYGLINEMLGNYEKALEYDFKALNLAEKIHDSMRIVFCNTNIGMVYNYYNKQYNKALFYYKKALQMAIKINDYREISGAYSNIGGTFRDINQLDSAIYYQKKALSIRKRYSKNTLNDIRGIALIYTNLAQDLFTAKKKDSAFFYNYKSIEMLNANNFEFEVTEVYLNMASFFKIDNELDSAIKYITKTIEIAKRLGLKNNLNTYLSFYADLLYKKGEYKKAYELLNEHTLLSDTIHSQESRKKIAELQAQYDNESYLRQIDKLEFTAKKTELQKIIYISSFIAILVVISGLLILVLIKKKRDKIIAKQKEELLQKEKELAQIQQKELNTKLEYKNKQLTTHTLSMLKKNRFLQELDKDIRDISKIVNQEYKSKFKRITTLIKYNSKSDNEWGLFKSYFEDVNQDFYQKLNHQFPDLSPNDYKICALIRLNMNIKESASILNISSGSLKTSRYRLRRKLNLEPKEDLHGFIQAI